MQFHLLPATILVGVCGFVSAQFKYPYPVEPYTLIDYTSGKVESALNFSAGDNIWGGWTTPVGWMSFFLLRCTHIPSSTPIYPSNSTFNSSVGQVSSDGTWEQMMFFSSGAFGSGVQSGSSPFLGYDFFVGNETTGQMCWFELYPGHDGQGESSVSGDGAFYFASMPFVVKNMRPSGQVVTWRDNGTPRGKPVKKFGGGAQSPNTTDSASSAAETTKDSGASTARTLGVNGASGLGVLLWLFVAGVRGMTLM
ncbi:hypothetical protein B0O99DRAFT_691150 [Bisporella sp. PMI_857]|nr:hypothetical protein B0O99DRAFT_691150 [Bisporella sp. PMI_857]